MKTMASKNTIKQARLYAQDKTAVKVAITFTEPHTFTIKRSDGGEGPEITKEFLWEAVNQFVYDMRRMQR